MAVLRNRVERTARTSARLEQLERDDQGDRDEHEHDVARANGDVGDDRTPPAENRPHEVRQRLAGIADLLGDDLLHDDRGRERRDEPADVRDRIELAEGLDRDEVEREPDERRDDEHEQQNHEDRDAAVEHAGIHPPTEVAADNDERALREVDDPRRREDQAVADRDERVDRADRQRVLERLDGFTHDITSVNLALGGHRDRVAGRIGRALRALSAPVFGEDLLHVVGLRARDSPPGSAERGGRDRCSCP